jgi:hypothetical protein
MFTLSLHDLVRVFLTRCYEFSHDAVEELKEPSAPLLA